MFNLNSKKLFFAILFFMFFLLIKNSSSQKIFNLIGKWKGINKSYSIEKGYRIWEKEITIFEQNEKIFKGNFKYSGGERNFLGSIRSNNKIFYWVSPKSKGYIHGEILGKNTIEVCYIEAYEEAAVGCSILKRLK